MDLIHDVKHTVGAVSIILFPIALIFYPFLGDLSDTVCLSFYNSFANINWRHIF